MFNWLKALLFGHTVDSVLTDFHGVLNKLDRVRANAGAQAAAVREQMSDLAVKHVELKSEAERAGDIHANIRALLTPRRGA